MLRPYERAFGRQLRQIPVIRTLPIFQYIERVVESIENNQVTIISGETGCGKSTQVPQYIYHYNRLAGR